MRQPRAAPAPRQDPLADSVCSASAPTRPPSSAPACLRTRPGSRSCRRRGARPPVQQPELVLGGRAAADRRRQLADLLDVRTERRSAPTGRASARPSPAPGRDGLVLARVHAQVGSVGPRRTSCASSGSSTQPYDAVIWKPSPASGERLGTDRAASSAVSPVRAREQRTRPRRAGRRAPVKGRRRQLPARRRSRGRRGGGRTVVVALEAVEVVQREREPAPARRNPVQSITSLQRLSRPSARRCSRRRTASAVSGEADVGEAAGQRAQRHTRRRPADRGERGGQSGRWRRRTSGWRCSSSPRAAGRRRGSRRRWPPRRAGAAREARIAAVARSAQRRADALRDAAVDDDGAGGGVDDDDVSSPAVAAASAGRTERDLEVHDGRCRRTGGGHGRRVGYNPLVRVRRDVRLGLEDLAGVQRERRIEERVLALVQRESARPARTPRTKRPFSAPLWSMKHTSPMLVGYRRSR